MGMKTQFQYKNFDFIKTSVGLGQAVGGGVGVGRSRGQEPASAASSEGRSIDDENWASRQRTGKRC